MKCTVYFWIHYRCEHNLWFIRRHKLCAVVLVFSIILRVLYLKSLSLDLGWHGFLSYWRSDYNYNFYCQTKAFSPNFPPSFMLNASTTSFKNIKQYSRFNGLLPKAFIEEWIIRIIWSVIYTFSRFVYIYLWGFFKNILYKTHSQTLDELKLNF